MLVLTRKQQEKIQIGDDIVITILRTKGKTVRLGIEAPPTVPVLRGELAVRIREESENDSTPQAADRAKRPPVDPTDPKSGGEPRGRDSVDETRVLHERAPRSRVATILPKMLGEPFAADAGPLRAMMDRRAIGASAR